MSETAFRVSLSPGQGVKVEFDLTGDEKPDDIEFIVEAACGVMKLASDTWDAWADDNADEHGKAMKVMMREQQEHQLAMWEMQKHREERAARILDEEGM